MKCGSQGRLADASQRVHGSLISGFTVRGFDDSGLRRRGRLGDAASGAIQLSFNPQLRVEFRGATVTSDAGLLLPRALDD